MSSTRQHRKRYRDRVTLQEPTDTNSFGEITQTWVDAQPVVCKITDTGGGERLKGGTVVDATTTSIIEMRYRHDNMPGPKWRAVQYDSTGTAARTFNVDRVQRLNEKEIRLFCTEDV